MRKIENFGDLAKLECDPSTPILLSAWNGYSDTYCVCDHALIGKYEEFENDFFGTEGKMDKRLFNGELCGKDVLFLGSKFTHRCKTDVDFLDDDPNIPIKLLNGKEGDPDLFWKSNGFEKVKKISGGEYWLLFALYDTNNRWEIAYYPQLDELEVTSTINGDEYHYYGKCIGIYDFIKAVEVCNINKSWRL